MTERLSTTRLVRYLLGVVVVMFAFGFALVPLYEVMCQAFGINGKTAGAYSGEQVVDESRDVRVQFLATNAAAWSGSSRPCRPTSGCIRGRPWRSATSPTTRPTSR